ncbi:MAG TPA: type II CAAX endopeptidase family protein [Vicinamibacterales bacterium]|nr:type II CAAX endopeptidase family protein [Vicinamibacterales bacterium]
MLAFFFLTFALTWGLWLAVVTPGGSGFVGLGGPVFLLGVFAPALVALALTAKAEGRVAVTRLLARIGIWQVPARWYVFAVSYLIAIKLTGALIYRMTSGAWPAFGNTPLPLMLGAIVLSTWVQAGEEVGWRGYALPRLAQRLGLGLASIVLGVIWALWHLPLFFMPGSGSDGQSFPIYLLHVTALSVAMAWLYWKTGGSLLLVMVMHASVNNTTGIVPAAVPGAANAFSFSGSPVAWITIALSWLVAVPLLVQMRSADIGAMVSQGVHERIGPGKPVPSI